MKTRIFAGVLLSVLLQSAAWGQGFGQGVSEEASRNANVEQGLLTIINMPTNFQTAPNGDKLDMSVTASRGGNNSGRPLGLYLPGDVEFKSDYKNLDARTMADWAYDLAILAKQGTKCNQRKKTDNQN